MLDALNDRAYPVVSAVNLFSATVVVFVNLLTDLPLSKGAHVLVIVGTSRAASIADSARAAEFELGSGDIARIDAATA